MIDGYINLSPNYWKNEETFQQKIQQMRLDRFKRNYSIFSNINENVAVVNENVKILDDSIMRMLMFQ